MNITSKDIELICPFCGGKCKAEYAGDGRYGVQCYGDPDCNAFIEFGYSEDYPEMTIERFLRRKL